MTSEEKIELIKAVAASAIRHFDDFQYSIPLDESVWELLKSYSESWSDLRGGMELFGITLSSNNRYWEYKGKILHM